MAEINKKIREQGSERMARATVDCLSALDGSMPVVSAATDQTIEEIANRILQGKGPDGNELVILARGCLDALARGRRAERIIHEWTHDHDQGGRK